MREVSQSRKKNVLAAKGKWTKWREEHIPEISQQTASLYMRLAENAEAVAKCISIRQADELLRALSSNSRSNASDKSDSAETESDEGEDEADDADDTNNALLVRQGASPDLKAMLQNTAVDEVYSVLTQATNLRSGSTTDPRLIRTNSLRSEIAW